jgi:hypothetical protein
MLPPGCVRESLADLSLGLARSGLLLAKQDLAAAIAATHVKGPKQG